MKIFEAIRVANKKRVPARIGRVQSVSTSEPLGSMVEHCHWRVRHEVTVAFEITGPEQNIPAMRDTAVRAIAHEVFGELKGDLLDLRNALWEEDFFREHDDPVLRKVESLLLSIDGKT